MKIIYVNDIGRRISEKEVRHLRDFRKYYLSEDDSVKKIELYENLKIERIDYFKDDGEAEALIIKMLLPYSSDFNIVFREFYGPYTVLTYNNYANDGILEFKWRELTLPNVDLFPGKQVVCTQVISIITDTIIHDETQKYLGWWIDDEDTEYCRFHYNTDGSLAYGEHNYLHEYDSQNLIAEDKQWLKERFGLSEAMYNYYLTDTFLPPLE